jgi:hypothetical protein
MHYLTRRVILKYLVEFIRLFVCAGFGWFRPLSARSLAQQIFLWGKKMFVDEDWKDIIEILEKYGSKAILFRRVR